MDTIIKRTIEASLLAHLRQVNTELKKIDRVHSRERLFMFEGLRGDIKRALKWIRSDSLPQGTGQTEDYQVVT
jgi:hypothetical protein